ncbi:MAG: transposase [Thermodesulfobacteriota bacterium]|nr:transposase [Thermodesulfobacteriota bacterium]
MVRPPSQSPTPEYIETFGDTMPFEHQKVINAIINCRIQYWGTMIYQCEECGKNHIVYRSCGNRHCPNCQHHKTHKWLMKEMKRQLPGHHFMITFTVPQQIRRFIRQHQRVCFSALFKASSETMKKLAANEKYIGGDMPGFLGVLHTWGRQLVYHPHIHYVVPGEAMSKKDGSWHPSRINFYLPVKTMSIIFKAKFRDKMRKSNLYSNITEDVWNQEWVVNFQPIGNSAHSIKYLAHYVFKVAISNSRIIKVENHKVFFKYKKLQSNRWRDMKLDVIEFIRRFLQHVLPAGFMKIRYYGFLSPGASIPIEKIKALIELSCGLDITKTEINIEPFDQHKCSHCGGLLKYIASIYPLRLIQSGPG